MYSFRCLRFPGLMSVRSGLACQQPVIKSARTGSTVWSSGRGCPSRCATVRAGVSALTQPGSGQLKFMPVIAPAAPLSLCVSVPVNLEARRNLSVMFSSSSGAWARACGELELGVQGLSDRPHSRLHDAQSASPAARFPLLLVRIAAMSDSDMARLEDPSGSCMAVVSRRVIEDYTRSMRVGGVLLLRQASRITGCLSVL
jgi:hypothetical protein